MLARLSGSESNRKCRGLHQRSVLYFSLTIWCSDSGFYLFPAVAATAQPSDCLLSLLMQCLHGGSDGRSQTWKTSLSTFQGTESVIRLRLNVHVFIYV